MEQEYQTRDDDQKFERETREYGRYTREYYISHSCVSI
jgi:hypothetical protein